MKQIILKVTCFLSILVLLLLLFSYLFIPKNNRSEDGMYNVKANGILGERKNSIDVFVIGDSEAYANISPLDIYDLYGYTMYISGTPGQLINNSYDYLKKALKTQQPKIVILEANTIFRKTTPTSVIKNIGKQVFPIFMYHNRWKSISWSSLFYPVKYTWTDELKGFNYSKKVKPAEKKEYMASSNELEKITFLNLYYLDQIRKLCEENHIEFVLLNTPNYKNWNYKKHNGVESYAKKYQIDYLDLNLKLEDLQIDWENGTRDKGDHLNYTGALKVSKYIGNYLERKKILIDHRNDPAYEKWNLDLKQFKEKVG